MRRTTVLRSSPLSLLALVALAVLPTAPGCSCSTSSGPEQAGDSGLSDVSVADAAMDGEPGSDGGTGDSSTSPDGSTGTGDGAITSDAGDAGDATACNQHLPTGFSQGLASATLDPVLAGNATGRTLSMVLDENDDPMFAYVDEAQGDAGETPYVIMFTRWDACAGAFTMPIQVDVNHSGGDVAIAYDPSTHEVGIAYEKDATDNNWADAYGTIWLASMRAPATTFSLQELNNTHTCCHGNGTLADWPNYAPAIAMQGGHIYIAYASTVGGGGDDEGLAWFLSSSSTYEAPPTSADGTGEYDAGPPPTGLPHDFAYTAVPFTGTPPNPNDVTAGFAFPTAASGSLSLALDSTGAPALATYEASGPNYTNFRTLFWRPGMATAVVADEFYVDNSIDLSLGFHGTSPVIAGHQVGTASSDTMTVVSSTDGTTWGTPVVLANGGTAFTSALAFDGAGNAAIASDTNGTNPTCAANPYIAFSTDDGATWSAACPSTAAVGYTTHAVNAAYGTSRLRGKLVVSFVNGSGGSTPPTESGIVIWQSP